MLKAIYCAFILCWSRRTHSAEDMDPSGPHVTSIIPSTATSPSPLLFRILQNYILYKELHATSKTSNSMLKPMPRRDNAGESFHGEQSSHFHCPDKVLPSFSAHARWKCRALHLCDELVRCSAVITLGLT